MGILPMSANSNIVSAQGQEETKTLIMTREDDIDSFDDLDGMTLDLSDKNIVPDADGKVEIDVNDAVPQGNMARNMIQGSLSFVIEGLSFEGMDTEYSNKTRTKFDDLRRCAVNLSPDGKKMLMFKQSRQGNVQYSFYDFSEVKRALGSNLSTDRSFRYNDKLAAACDSDVINASNVPNGQLQGIAIDNDSNIYIVSDGDGTYDIRANLSVIFKKSKKTVYYNVYGDINEMIYYCKGETLEIEIEGIQVINDKIYIGIAPREQNLRKKAFIYSIDNGLIHE